MDKSMRRLLLLALSTALLMALAGMVSADPPKTSSSVPRPRGTPPQDGTPLEYQGGPPPTPTGPSQTWTGSDGKQEAASQTVPGQGGVWTLTWTALYALAWTTVRRKKQVPVYKSETVSEPVQMTRMVKREVQVGFKKGLVRTLVGYKTEVEKRPTGRFREWTQKLITGYRTVMDKVQTGVRRWAVPVQRGFKSVLQTVVKGYRTITDRVFVRNEVKTRTVAETKTVTETVPVQKQVQEQYVAGHRQQWDSKQKRLISVPIYGTRTYLTTVNETRTRTITANRTETYTEPVYETRTRQEPIYGQGVVQVPNMVDEERSEPTYEWKEKQVPIEKEIVHREEIYDEVKKDVPVYEMRPGMVPDYRTETVEEPYTETRAGTRQVQVGTTEVEVEERVQQPVFDGWKPSWSFTSAPAAQPVAAVPSGQALNEQLFAQQQLWWDAHIRKDQKSKDTAAAEGQRLRALGATVPAEKTAAMSQQKLHDALIADKHAWWQAYMSGKQDGMDRATTHADYLRSIGAVVSDEETQAINREYEAMIAARKPEERGDKGNASSSDTGILRERRDRSDRGSSRDNTNAITEKAVPATPVSSGAASSPAVVSVDPRPATDIDRLKAQIREAKRNWWNEWIANKGDTNTTAQQQAKNEMQKAKDEARLLKIPFEQIDITEAENWEFHADALHRVTHKWWAASLAHNKDEQNRMAELANYLRGERLKLKSQSATYARLAAEEGMQEDGDLSKAQNDSINRLYQDSMKAAGQARLSQLAAAAKSGWLTSIPANDAGVSQLVKAAGKPGEAAAAAVTADFTAFRDALTNWWKYVDDPAAFGNKVASDAEATMNQITAKYKDTGSTFPAMDAWGQHQDRLQALNEGFQARVSSYWAKGQTGAEKVIPVWMRQVSAANKAWYEKNAPVFALKVERWDKLSKVSDQTPLDELLQIERGLKEVAAMGEQAPKDGATLPTEWYPWEKEQSAALSSRYQKYHRKLLRLQVLANYEADDRGGMPTVETQQTLERYDVLVRLMKPYVLDAADQEKQAHVDQNRDFGELPGIEQIRWIQALYGITGEKDRYGAKTRETVAALQESIGEKVDDWVSIGPQTLKALHQEHIKLVHGLWHAGKGADVAREIKRIEAAGGNPDWVAEMRNLDRAYTQYRQSKEKYYQAILTRATNTGAWSDDATYKEIDAAEKAIGDAEAAIGSLGGSPVELDSDTEENYRKALRVLREQAETVVTKADDDDYATLLAKLDAVRSENWAMVGNKVTEAKSTSWLDGHHWKAFGVSDDVERQVGFGIIQIIDRCKQTTNGGAKDVTLSPIVGQSLYDLSGDGTPLPGQEMKVTREQIITVYKKHGDLIKTVLKGYPQFEIALIAAIILRESSGDAKGLSPNWAQDEKTGKKWIASWDVGLMQVNMKAETDETAEAARKRLAYLFEPERNISEGVGRLAGKMNFLSTHLGQPQVSKMGLQAYNFGEGNIENVLRQTMSKMGHPGINPRSPKNDQEREIIAEAKKYWMDNRKSDPQHSSKTWGGNPYYYENVMSAYRQIKELEATGGLDAQGVRDGYVPRYDGTTPANGTEVRSAVLPVSYDVDSDVIDRSQGRYDDVINQFAVGVNKRYQKRDSNGDGEIDTFCNIFTWDVTRAMGAEIPHWVHKETDEPADLNDVVQRLEISYKRASDKYRELDANATVKWLASHGSKYGWRTATAQEAQLWANQGRPAVVVQNRHPIGHVAMVRPGTYDANKGPTIAQAGDTNFNVGTVKSGFGGLSEAQLYYIHD